ncbi:ATP-binding protein [Cellulomonas hominis]|nr:hypothetical protein AGMMS50218_03120 [Actinomycetota bacterium]
MTETDTITLARHPRSVRIGRRWAARYTSEHGGSVRASRVVELLTSEVVTNAVVHPAIRGAITLRADVQGEEFLIAVSDADPQRPVVRSAHPGRVGGHGMRLVEALSTSWGVNLRVDGKTVWFRAAW